MENGKTKKRWNAPFLERHHTTPVEVPTAILSVTVYAEISDSKQIESILHFDVIAFPLNLQLQLQLLT